MTSDLDLLGQYARNHSQDAFSEIVRRHLDLVYSAALRQVHSSQLAEEVAQSVFADLARNAGSFGDGGDASSPKTLTPWLYAVTRRTAIDVIRKESRRQLREQIAVEMNHMNAPQSSAGFQPAWTEIESFLDDAMAALEEADRSAVLLRYFENKTLREVGEALGASEDAAQKRVSRAVERLREFFSKRNVTIGASGLAVLVSANAVQAAPVGLAATISAAAVLAGTAVHTSTLIAATKTIAMTTIQKAIIGATLAAAVGTGIFEAHQNSHLREQVQAFQQQQARLADQLRQLRHERDDVSNQLAALLAENQRLQSNSNETELLTLRAEVTRLSQTSSDDSREALVKSWLERRDKLKQLAQQNPGKSIPEFQLLSEQQWLDSAMNATFETDQDIQQDLAGLRRTAENDFAPQMEDALSRYIKDNHGQFPADLSQLQPYFKTPVDPAILDRWTIAPANAVPGVGVGDRVITEKVPVDPALDSHWAIGQNGYGSTTYQSADISTAMATLDPAMKAYAAANNGQQPGDPSELLPYLTSPEQQAALQKILQKKSKNATPP